MLASSVLKKKFDQSQNNKVALDGKKLDEIQWMLDCIYPNVLFDITGKQ